MDNMQNCLDELNSLEEHAISSLMPERELFKLIGNLDKKHGENIEYKLNINGVICNIASSLGY